MEQQFHSKILDVKIKMRKYERLLVNRTSQSSLKICFQPQMLEGEERSFKSWSDQKQELQEKLLQKCSVNAEGAEIFLN